MELGDILNKAKSTASGRKAQQTTADIPFVRAGEDPTTRPSSSKPRRSILDGVGDWQMRIDLGKRLRFPDVVTTTLRPDIVVWSESHKKLFMVELTVPWEEAMDAAFERKKDKYHDLEEDVKHKGWTARTFPVEIGTRGFSGQSLHRLLSSFAVLGRDRCTAVRRLSEAAEKASCWLWFRREQREWKPSSDGQ